MLTGATATAAMATVALLVVGGGPTYVDTNRATSILTKLGFTGISTSIPYDNRDCGSDGQGVRFYATPPFGGKGARMSGTVCLPKDDAGVVKFDE